MLEDADIDAGYKKFLQDVVVITRFCALLLRFNHFAGDLIRILEVLGKDVRVRGNVARGLRQWGTDVDRKTHLESKHEARRREVS